MFGFHIVVIVVVVVALAGGSNYMFLWLRFCKSKVICGTASFCKAICLQAEPASSCWWRSLLKPGSFWRTLGVLPANIYPCLSTWWMPRCFSAGLSDGPLQKIQLQKLYVFVFFYIVLKSQDVKTNQPVPSTQPDVAKEHGNVWQLECQTPIGYCQCVSYLQSFWREGIKKVSCL